MRMKLLLPLGLVLCAVSFHTAFASKPEPRHQYVRGQACNPQGAASLCFPLDNTWTVVQFSGDANCSGPADPNDPCQRNDDDHTVAVNLGFTFNLYGASYNQVYINNNGNLSFDAGYCTYTSQGFPISGFPMVAPFWADVDTRDPASGVVYMKQGANYLAVTWDHVGYYGQHSDKLNTFQVIITDGSNDQVGLGNNVCFCYGDMQWTTGDASGGSGGFGGSPATVGVNKGDGVLYSLIGQFDHPGNDYNGPGGAPSGVDYLDGKHFCFAAGAENNLPPVGIDFPQGDSICVAVGQTLHTQIGFIGPEGDQTVHTDVDPHGLANFSYTSTDGNPSIVDMTFTPAANQLGDHNIDFTATDNFNPPGVTHATLVICVTQATPTRATSWGKLKTLYHN